LAYGPDPRQFVDLYRPEGAAKGLFVFVHGGYWHLRNGRDFSYLGAGPLARGCAVAIVNYRLAPQVRIRQITEDVRDALRATAAAVDGPVYLAGHSAGGHLVSRMGCQGVLEEELAARIVRILSISGLHDLRPLLRVKMNEALRLDAEEAAAESPALLLPLEGLEIACVVGANELPELVRQTDLLANIWRGLAAETRAIHMPGLHHFDVIDSLALPDGALTRMLLDQSLS
jgi:acetyl esterase/lipase